MTASSTATTTTGVSGTFSVTSPANFSAGAYKVSYKLGGDTACPCRPSSDEDLPCKGGCNDGSGVLPMPDELVIVRNSDHITVFERLGIAVGALPVTPAYAIPAFACDEALDGFEFVSTHPWQKSELTISRAEVNALKCSQWVTEETTETELAWTREVEAAYPCPCKESDVNTGVFSSESDHLRQLSTFFQLSRYVYIRAFTCSACICHTNADVRQVPQRSFEDVRLCTRLTGMYHDVYRTRTHTTPHIGTIQEQNSVTGRKQHLVDTDSNAATRNKSLSLAVQAQEAWIKWHHHPETASLAT